MNNLIDLSKHLSRGGILYPLNYYTFSISELQILHEWLDEYESDTELHSHGNFSELLRKVNQCLEINTGKMPTQEIFTTEMNYSEIVPVDLIPRARFALEIPDISEVYIHNSERIELYRRILDIESQGVLHRLQKGISPHINATTTEIIETRDTIISQLIKMYDLTHEEINTEDEVGFMLLHYIIKRRVELLIEIEELGSPKQRKLFNSDYAAHALELPLNILSMSEIEHNIRSFPSEPFEGYRSLNDLLHDQYSIRVNIGKHADELDGISHTELHILETYILALRLQKFGLPINNDLIASMSVEDIRSKIIEHFFASADQITDLVEKMNFIQKIKAEIINSLRINEITSEKLENNSAPRVLLKQISEFEPLLLKESYDNKADLADNKRILIKMSPRQFALLFHSMMDSGLLSANNNKEELYPILNKYFRTLSTDSIKKSTMVNYKDYLNDNDREVVKKYLNKVFKKCNELSQ
jgi:plasmid maintenance system killer protein